MGGGLTWRFDCIYSLESFRFLGEDDDENKIFSTLRSARARTNVILAGKCDSSRQSTTSFSKNVVVAKTSYQMLEILPFSDRERASPPSTEISVLTLMVKKVKCSFPENRRESLKLNVINVLGLESKAVYYSPPNC